MKKATKTKATRAVAVRARAASLGRADAALRAEFQRLHAALVKLRTAEGKDFDAMWETVGRIIEGDRPIFLGGGYRTLAAFVAKELPGETARTVKRNVLVARCFTAQDEARHGASLLEELALYAQEVAGADAPPGPIDLDRLRVPMVTRDGDHVRKPAREVTIDEVRKARRGLRKGPPKHRASPRETALRAVIAKHARLRKVAVRTSAEGVRFGVIPWSDLKAMAKLLASLKLPKE